MRPFTTLAMVLVVLMGFCGFYFEKKKDPRPYPFPKLEFFPPMPRPAANPVTIEGVALGRFLFYDPILSADSSFSCASCHRQEKAFSDGGNRFSRGLAGEPLRRNTMPLFNLAWYRSYFWDGKAESLEAQVLHPVRAAGEMNLAWHEAARRVARSPFYRPKFLAAFGDAPIDSLHIAKAIAQFERSLISHHSKYDQVLRGESYFTTEEYNGFVLVNDQTKGDCLHCHTTDADALGTTGRFSNNGLDAVRDFRQFSDPGRGGITHSENDFGLFKIPSLRNLPATAPYMHDGRFATLEQVMDFYSEGVQPAVNIDSKMGFAHRGGARLSPTEKSDIIAFLKTLSDSMFLTDPQFSNPFINE